jgi:hypothetical protein
MSYSMCLFPVYVLRNYNTNPTYNNKFTDTENAYKPAYDVTVVRMVLQCWSTLGVLTLLLFNILSMREDPEVICLNLVTICMHTIIFITLLCLILPQHATKSTKHHFTFNDRRAGLPVPTHVTRDQYSYHVPYKCNTRLLIIALPKLRAIFKYTGNNKHELHQITFTNVVFPRVLRTPPCSHMTS